MENFNREMEKVIQGLKGQSVKPKLLLHACCAPCSSACIERLKDVFDITVFFYNPNMDTLEEYSLRSDEQVRLCKEFDVECYIADYSSKDFTTSVVGREDCVEGGERCSICYALRLKKTAEYAKANGYDYFTTTLTISPLKDAYRLNQIGKSLAEQTGVNFLPSDFKKKGGYQRSIELSKQFNLYRQNYCGCKYSKNICPQE